MSAVRTTLYILKLHRKETFSMVTEGNATLVCTSGPLLLGFQQKVFVCLFLKRALPR